MLKVERLVHKVALRVSEKTKKAVEFEDTMQRDSRDSAPASSITEPSHRRQQQEEEPASKNPHSQYRGSDHPLRVQPQVDQNGQNYFPPLDVPSGELIASVPESKRAPCHKHSWSVPNPKQTSEDELWIQNEINLDRTKSNSFSEAFLPQTLASTQPQSRTPSPKYLTPHYSPAPNQRQHASSFSIYPTPKTSPFAELVVPPAKEPEKQLSRPLNTPRTRSAPTPTRRATIRSDTTQIIKSRHLSIHPASLLPGPHFSPYRPPTPPMPQYQAYVAPSPIPALPSQIWPLPNEPLSNSKETPKQSPTKTVEDASSTTPSARSPPLLDDDESPSIGADTPSTVVETPVEQGLATKVVFQGSRDTEPKVLVMEHRKCKTVQQAYEKDQARRDS